MGVSVVEVVVYRPDPDGQYEILAEAVVERGKLRLECPRDDLVETSRLVFSNRRKKLAKFEDDHEEWLRSFAESFRNAHVGAVIVKDTTHRELVAPKDLREHILAAI